MGVFSRLGKMERFGCLRLRTLTLIVGWIGVVFAVIVTILLAMCLANLDEVAKAFAERSPNGGARADEVRSTILIVLVAYLILNLIGLVLSSLLLAGTVKGRPKLMLPWIIYSGIALALNALNVVLQFIGFFLGVHWINFIFSFAVLVLQFYIWNAIYSFYKQLRASNDEPHRVAPDEGAPAVYQGLSKI